MRMDGDHAEVDCPPREQRRGQCPFAAEALNGIAGRSSPAGDLDAERSIVENFVH